MPGGTSFPLLAIFVILLNIAFWGAIVAVSVSLVKRNSDQPSNNHVKPAAVDVLEQRYARGEISHQEFIERRAVLMDEPPESPSTSSGTGPSN